MGNGTIPSLLLWNQTNYQVLEVCPITRFEGGIAKLHEAKPEPINWLNSLETPL